MVAQNRFLSCFFCRVIMLNIFDPLEQFEIFVHSFSSCGSYFSTNISFFILFFCVCILCNFRATTLFSAISGGGSFIFNTFIFVKKLNVTNISILKQVFFSYLLFLFLFVLISNLVGLVPFSFTLTAQFSVTFFLSLSVFIGLIIIGICTHNFEVLNLFLPGGVPLVLVPFIFILEVISFFARVFSLSIRLFANMMAGHTLLKILSTFFCALFSKIPKYFIFFLFVPFCLILVILSLEFAIAFFQAYVFLVLLTIYLNDIINLH